MTETPTTAALLARTRAARAAWDAIFATVPPGRLEEPGAVGWWSAKDVQAHFNSDHRWIVGQLRAGRRGELPTAAECYGHDRVPPDGVDLADQDQRNAWRYTFEVELTLAETLADAPVWEDALEAAIAALPDAELARDYTFGDHAHIAHLRPAEAGEPAWPFWQILASYADEHYAAHTADLRAWLAMG